MSAEATFNFAGKAALVRPIAEAILWLVSDAASYVTGETPVVDGGVARVENALR